MNKATVAKNIRDLHAKLSALYNVLGESFPLVDAMKEGIHRNQRIISVKVVTKGDMVTYTVVFEKEGFLNLNFTVSDELLWFLIKRTNTMLFGVANPQLARFSSAAGLQVNTQLEPA